MIDGRLADCFAGRGPDEATLLAAGLGQPSSSTGSFTLCLEMVPFEKQNAPRAVLSPRGRMPSYFFIPSPTACVREC